MNLLGDQHSTVVGLLHPGEMGAAIGRQLVECGQEVLWCSADRSELTAVRARDAGLTETTDLDEIVGRSEVIFSICPPNVAESIAKSAADLSYSGIWVEANPITPQRLNRMGAMLDKAITLDGGIIGSPPAGAKRCTLYLSGSESAASIVAGLFGNTLVSTNYLGGELGRASALKLSYGSFQKASRLLAALSYALARYQGVERELLEVAGKRSGSYLSEVDYTPKLLARAGRWGAELSEGADMLRDADLPDDLLRSAAAILNGLVDDPGRLGR